MYRPLSYNEYIIVSQTIYQERGLSGGLADSMFLAYTGRAMALDVPEFEVFKDSEVERRQRQVEKQREKNPATTEELGPMEFLKALEELSKNSPLNTVPDNCYVWFYGDEQLLDAQHKRLRVKFFNSERYRKQVLHTYLKEGVIQDEQLKDTVVIGTLLKEFHRQYPATRQGIISYYEIFFGDPSGFSYQTAMQRSAFHNMPEFRREILKKLNLPENLSIKKIREHLKQSALDTEAVTPEQIAQWEILEPKCE